MTCQSKFDWVRIMARIYSLSMWKLVPATAFLALVSCTDPRLPSENLTHGGSIEVADPSSWGITEIYWSDADSGRINGARFRLSDIDAPETGGVGAAIGGAKCEKERERGFAAKEFIVELTRSADLKISATYGYDKMKEPR